MTENVVTIQIWLVVARAGRYMTAAEIVEQLPLRYRLNQEDRQRAQTLIWSMALRKGQLDSTLRSGSRNRLYAVTTKCKLPGGMVLEDALKALGIETPAEETEESA